MTRRSATPAIGRRALLQSAVAVLGAGVAGAGCVSQPVARVPRFAPRLFDSERALLVEDLSDLILPASDTPGALEAGVPAFIESVVRDVDPEPRRAEFLAGLDQLNERARRSYGQAFAGCARSAQQALLERLIADTRAELALDAEREPFFVRFRELAIVGLCRSEPGATRLLRYQAVPGRYRGCVSRASVGRTWALQ